jgi:hypothetical protein
VSSCILAVVAHREVCCPILSEVHPTRKLSTHLFPDPVKNRSMSALRAHARQTGDKSLMSNLELVSVSVSLEIPSYSSRANDSGANSDANALAGEFIASEAPA